MKWRRLSRTWSGTVICVLPKLTNALEEAGCDNVDILTRCWETGEHVRGCWVVDVIRSRDC